MNRGIARAALIARMHKEAGVTDAAARGVLGLGAVARGVGKTVAGAGKAWGKGSEAIGRSVSQQLSQAGVRGAGLKGRAVSGALKAAPVGVAGYYGYQAFKPEVESAKARLGQALRGRYQLFKARRRAAMPYYHEGRFQ